MNENYTDVAEHVLKLARERGADDAEVMLSSGRNFTATVRLGEIERIQEAATRTLGLRVFKDGRTANRYTSDLTPRGLSQFVDRTLDLIEIADPDPAAALPEWEERPEDPDLQLYDPAVEAMSAEEKIERALRAERAALDFDPRITNSGGASFATMLRELILYNSRGTMGRYTGTVASSSMQAIADDADGKKRNDYWFSVERHLDRMDGPETLGRTAAERAVRHLGARKVATRAVPIVFDPTMASSLLGLIGHAASGELLYRRASFLVDLEGQTVGSPQVTIVDDPLLASRVGSRPFDDEGVASRRNPLLVDGVFQGFLFDTHTARQLGRKSTGNSSRSVGGPASVGTSNLVLVPGLHDLRTIIASVEDGFYVTEMIGHGVNMTDGTFSRGAGGMWIEKGKLAYPVSEVNISGNLKEMLAGISMVGSDLTWQGDSAAPTLKIDRMMVSGL
ncbi:MAG: TldD/PmbA family protein [Dehalococcoidia bacterium]